MRLHFWMAGAVLAGGLATAADGLAARGPVSGDRVLFISNRDGEKRFSVFTMKPDGSEQASLTAGEGIELDPVWSPDGKRIAFAFAGNPEGKRADIYVMNADGGGRTKVTQGDGINLSPSWSADGKRLAYCTAQVADGMPPKTTISVIDVGGTNAQTLGEGTLPEWSPDGKQILFTVIDASAQKFGMSVMDADGKNVKPLPVEKAVMGAWSPDGKRIAYISVGEGNQSDVFVMNADGTSQTRVAQTPEMEYGPVWSADGKRLYFTRMKKDGGGPQDAEIWVMDADGKNIRQLTMNNALDVVGGGFFLLMITRSGG